ncbi:MAG: hypothetical protein KGI84_06600, partial [Elusimicrobia bacterium]|nr:hypothetical protein [Elusimicrobiota bacterium]
APLAYGQTFLDESLVDKTQGGQAAAVSINGTLDAAVLNRDGQGVKYYQGSDAVEKAAKTWIMAGVAMKGENAAVENGGQVKTNYRLDYYEDPATKLPVELSERYVRDRVEHDKHSLFYREHWGFMPQNWFSLVMNVPDQIIGTPIELAGRDPNRQHYLGRVNMNHSEGGETQHHGFFRSALGFVDVLDLLPDPVKIYDDPSQFPTQSRISSPVMPGQDVYSKSLRNPKDGENVHFGAKAVAQGLRYSLEDLTDVQQQTLSYFRGGYEDLIISRMRGRDGTYEESQRTARSGAGAIKDKLENQGADDEAYDPLAAADARSAMNGVTETASPDNVLTEKVERDVKVRLGAQQYEQASKGFDAYSADMNKAISQAKGGEGKKLADSLSAGQAALKEALIVRDRAQASLDETWSRYHAIESRMETEDAVDRGIVLWQKRVDDLAAQLKAAQAQVNALAKDLQQAVSRTAAGASPTPSKVAAAPSPARSRVPIWPWVFFLGGLISLLAAAWEALRLRILHAKRID